MEPIEILSLGLFLPMIIPLAIYSVFSQHLYYPCRTVAIGEGVPPKETFSTLVVVVISLGVVLPAAMFLVGCGVLAVRRWRQHNSSDSILITPE